MNEDADGASNRIAVLVGNHYVNGRGTIVPAAPA